LNAWSSNGLTNSGRRQADGGVFDDGLLGGLDALQELLALSVRAVLDRIRA
jgi:hypothetical protein